MAKKQNYISASVFNAGGKEYKPGDAVNLTEEDIKLYLSTGMIYETAAQENLKREPSDTENPLEETIKEKDERIKELEEEVEQLRGKAKNTEEAAVKDEEKPEKADVKSK